MKNTVSDGTVVSNYNNSRTVNQTNNSPKSLCGWKFIGRRGMRLVYDHFTFTSAIPLKEIKLCSAPNSTTSKHFIVLMFLFAPKKHFGEIKYEKKYYKQFIYSVTDYFS